MAARIGKKQKWNPYKDKTGQQYGDLTCLGPDQDRPRYWILECECGRRVSMHGNKIRQDCGCVKEVARDKKFIGQQYGRLTILERDPKDKSSWIVQCDCGVRKSLSNKYWKRVQSCGCMVLDKDSPWNRSKWKHGLCDTPEYEAWLGMKSRHPELVCARWQVLENFLKDMGEKPSPKHRLTRQNPQGEYSKRNCYWGLRKKEEGDQELKDLLKQLLKLLGGK